MPPQTDLSDQLADILGRSIDWGEHRVWLPEGTRVEVVVSKERLAAGKLVDLRKRRDDRRAASVIAICPGEQDGAVRVVGPIGDGSVREFAIGSVATVLDRALDGDHAGDAAAFIEREFRRLEESVVPGVRVKDLLTPYFVRERLLSGDSGDRRRGDTGDDDRAKLESAVSALELGRRVGNWRQLITGLGWDLVQRSHDEFVLKHDSASRAVLHVKHSAVDMSRMSRDGVLPEGALISACGDANVDYGIMAHGSRLRLFRARPEIGSAVSQFIEVDVAEAGPEDRIALGLFSPDALKEGGHFYEWERRARAFGEDLREDLQKRLIEDVLPTLARGIGKWQGKKGGVDLSAREELDRIERAVLTLVFRVMFLLHVEARNYLPVTLPSYRSHSATKLARDSARFGESRDAKRKQRLWPRLKKLVAAVRNGDDDLGVPQYNGSLFAADGFPGSELLEQVDIADEYLAPALRDIAYQPGNLEAGLDYASLQIGHLGAIYESLLSRRLALAREGLVLKSEGKKDDAFYAPAGRDETPEIAKNTLFYQNEKGGRKAGGVYYTRREFVVHLLNNSLEPALKDHFARIDKLLEGGKNEQVAKELFEFYLVDPAMGSGHFLTVALDMMADRFDEYVTRVDGMAAVREELLKLRANIEATDYEVDDVDLLRRLILKRCIYGVDISPLAVEIANVTLWLGSFVPGLALSYLGSNLKCGDALVGVADPTSILSATRGKLFSARLEGAMKRAGELDAERRAILDVNAVQVQLSEAAEMRLRDATSLQRRVFDLWTAGPLGLEQARDHVELHAEEVTDIGQKNLPEVDAAIERAQNMAGRYRFLHWKLEFPQVFHGENPGYDVVVGNPPWNEITIERLEFFAQHIPGLRGMSSNEREKLLGDIRVREPDLVAEFEFRQARLDRQRGYFRACGDYPDQGVGDPNLYKLFCERYDSLTKEGGSIGVVLPGGILTNKGSRKFMRWLTASTEVRRIDRVANIGGWAFKDVSTGYEIALLATRDSIAPSDHEIGVTGPAGDEETFLANAAADPPSVSQSLLQLGMVPRIPDIQYEPVIRQIIAGQPFECVSECYFDGSGDPGSVAQRPALIREIDESIQKALFRHARGLEVWNGECSKAYQPIGGDVVGYANKSELLKCLHDSRKSGRKLKRLYTSSELDDQSTLPIFRARVAYHDVAGPTASDTVVACLIPPMIALVNSAPYLACRWPESQQAFLLGVLNSTAFDWQARRFVQLHLSHFILNALRFPPAKRVIAPAPPHTFVLIQVRLRMMHLPSSGSASRISRRPSPA